MSGVDQLVKIRVQRFKEAIGFERQNREKEQRAVKLSHARQQAEALQNHEAVSLAEAKLDHQKLLNAALDSANFRLGSLEKAA